MLAPQFYQPETHWCSFDRQMMSRALKLAAKGQFTARPNPMVGCVITRDQQIVGEGWHQTFGQAHAEVNALAQARDQAKGATCYVTLEPCAHTGKTGPCAEALVRAGVARVVAASCDPNPLVAGKGLQILKDAGIQVEHGLLAAQANQLNPGFISLMTRGRPWLTCKLAMSLDGKTALANGKSQWITGAESRADVQKLRASQDAIITGSGTLLADNPSLTIRQADTMPALNHWYQQALSYGFRAPVRILLDRQARAPLNAKLFSTESNVLWFTDSSAQDGSVSSPPSHIQHLATPDSLLALMALLGQRGFSRVLLESGHRLAGAFLRAGLIDELVIYVAPKLMGDQGMGLFELLIEQMDQAIPLKRVESRWVGEDQKLVFRPDNSFLDKSN